MKKAVFYSNVIHVNEIKNTMYASSLQSLENNWFAVGTGSLLAIKLAHSVAFNYVDGFNVLASCCFNVIGLDSCTVLCQLALSLVTALHSS